MRNDGQHRHNAQQQPAGAAGEVRRIAVVGGGAAGIASAHYLSKRHDVTLYEKAPRLGGHVHTALVHEERNGKDSVVPVDMGFIVCNDRTYPLFTAFLQELGVRTADTEMSFSFWDKSGGAMYAGTGLNGLFAKRSDILRPGHWRFLRDLLRFGRAATRDLVQGGDYDHLTLGEYVERRGFTGSLIRDFTVPMIGAIWSAGDGDAMQFPAKRFALFFHNHGLLTFFDRPQWKYIPGGSRTYVDAFEQVFPGKAATGDEVIAVRRNGNIRVSSVSGGEHEFDAVVMACHADDALRLLVDADEKERELLGVWKYNVNDVRLHTDEGALPPLARARAAWNAVREIGAKPEDPVTVSYDMNRLQRLQAQKQYIVTLNSQSDVVKETTIEHATMSHPRYEKTSEASQLGLGGESGRRGVFFAGAYMRHGFHEDAFNSAARVAEAFHIPL